MNSGTEFTYVDYADNDIKKTMTLENKGESILFHSDPLSVPAVINVKCSGAPGEVVLNDAPVPFEYDAKKGIVSIDAEAGISVRLRIVLNSGQ